MHGSIHSQKVEMEMKDGRPTGRSILVLEVDAVIDPKSPDYRQPVINDIINSANEAREKAGEIRVDGWRLVRKTAD